MENLIIEKLRQEDMDETARMLALAFSNNPNMKAVWADPGTGKALHAVEEIMKAAKLKRKYSNVFVAKTGNKIAGAINFAIWPDCQPKGPEKLAMLPKLLSSFGTKLPKAIKIMSAWEKHDPAKPHYHIGPLAVLPQYQGKGIGTRLLQHCLHLADKASVPCYLETDAALNLPLYERHGFTTIREVRVYDYSTWLMWRNVNAEIKKERLPEELAGEHETG